MLVLPYADFWNKLIGVTLLCSEEDGEKLGRL